MKRVSLFVLCAAVIFTAINVSAAETERQKQADRMAGWMKDNVDGTCPNCYDTFILPAPKAGPADTAIMCPSCKYKTSKSEFIGELKKK